jgi:hypothetical protein
VWSSKLETEAHKLLTPSAMGSARSAPAVTLP